MRALTRLNRILLVWLLILAGLGLDSAHSLAACDKDGKMQATSGHTCCDKKTACTCGTPSQNALQAAGHSGTRQAGCSCAMRPQPVDSAPKSEPLYGYAIIALPTRAGPVVPSTSPAATGVSSEPGSFSYRYAASSPPRAPPFQA